jgi:hypothetical protein
LVREDVEAVDQRGSPIPAVTQVLAFLRYAAENCHQVTIAELLRISQQSVSDCIYAVARSLCRQRNRFIHFPNHIADQRVIKRAFLAVRGFPNVVGLIDCTHIPIQAPAQAIERDYVNRKGRHSINVQGIVDHRGRFLNVVAMWPGSAHDSFILRSSEVWQAFEDGNIDGVLLGDSGYSNRHWLMTPFPRPANAHQRR